MMMGKLLRVNLTTRQITEEPYPEALARQFMGGAAAAIKLVYDEVDPRVDALGPDNKLIAAVAGASRAAPGSPHRGLTDEEAATLIRVVLQSEREMPLASLAEELGLSDRQFGMGLGLLIREGRAKIREGYAGLMVSAPDPAER
jgi:hypothetical protein